MSHRCEETCYCKTCDRWFHYLGIARHRAMHRDKHEYCEIIYTDGTTYSHDFATSQFETKNK